MFDQFRDTAVSQGMVFDQSLMQLYRIRLRPTRRRITSSIIRHDSSGHGVRLVPADRYHATYPLIVWAFHRLNRPITGVVFDQS